MKYIIIIYFFIGVCFHISAQLYDTIKCVNLTKTYHAYLPKGLQVIDTAQGDFNSDNLLDVILVLDSVKYASEYGSSPRKILILQKTKTAYTKALFNANAILGKHDGGVFGDPYSSISLNKNILTINHYGGSAWRWGNEIKFRFQHNNWVLIGLREISYWVNGDCQDVGTGAFNQTDVNFLTNKAHIIRTEDNACKPYLNIWKKFKKAPLVTLSSFDIENEYIPKELRKI